MGKATSSLPSRLRNPQLDSTPRLSSRLTLTVQPTTRSQSVNVVDQVPSSKPRSTLPLSWRNRLKMLSRTSSRALLSNTSPQLQLDPPDASLSTLSRTSPEALLWHSRTTIALPLKTPLLLRLRLQIS